MKCTAGGGGPRQGRDRGEDPTNRSSRGGSQWSDPGHRSSRGGSQWSDPGHRDSRGGSQWSESGHRDSRGGSQWSDSGGGSGSWASTEGGTAGDWDSWLGDSSRDQGGVPSQQYDRGWEEPEQESDNDSVDIISGQQYSGVQAAAVQQWADLEAYSSAQEADNPEQDFLRAARKLQVCTSCCLTSMHKSLLLHSELAVFPPPSKHPCGLPILRRAGMCNGDQTHLCAGPAGVGSEGRAGLDQGCYPAALQKVTLFA